MKHRYATVSFLSDYGTGDEFVGVVKSVIRAIEPEAAVIDVTHEIPPHDVRAGSLALARAAQYLVPGWCSPWSIPASAPTAGPSPSRSVAASPSSSAPTTACWPRPSAWSVAPTGSSS